MEKLNSITNISTRQVMKIGMLILMNYVSLNIAYADIFRFKKEKNEKEHKSVSIQAKNNKKTICCVLIFKYI